MDMKFKNNVMERSQKSQEGGEKKNKNQIMVYARPIILTAIQNRGYQTRVCYSNYQKREIRKIRANHKEETFRN